MTCVLTWDGVCDDEEDADKVDEEAEEEDKDEKEEERERKGEGRARPVVRWISSSSVAKPMFPISNPSYADNDTASEWMNAFLKANVSPLSLPASGPFKCSFII